MCEANTVTPVIFRWDAGQVVAVFPTDAEGHNMMGCYAHLGQHSGCSLDWYYTTRPARPAEYANLKAELEAAPYRYKFKVYQRITPGLRDEWRKQNRRG